MREITEKEYNYLTLFFLYGVGPVSVKRFLENGSTVHEIVQTHYEKIVDKLFIDKIQSEITRCFENCWDFITYEDERYPESLRQIQDPPMVLFYSGDITLLAHEERNIAVVGSRVTTQYGRAVADSLSEKIVDAGGIIVSGFMSGIDTVAHKAALRKDKPTIAVLGSGLLHIAPASNRHLVEPILKNGLLISEFLPTMRATKFTFPARNRIVAALSKAVVVVEAGKKSGALITARLGSEYGKEVYAVPGSVFSSQSAGAHWLLAQGANVMGDFDAFIAIELGNNVRETISDTGFSSVQHAEVYRAIFSGACKVDDLVSELAIDARRIQIILFELEVKEKIRALGNGEYVVNL